MGHYYTLQIWILLLLDITQISDAFSYSVGILTKTKQHHHRTAPLALSEQEDGGGIGVGIDLGTTNSAVAFLDGDTPCIIEIPNNGRTMSSVVAFDDGDDGSSSLVGAAAIDWERNKHQSAYRHVKRIIGSGADFVPSEILDVVPHVVAIPHLEEESSSSSSKKKKKKKKKTKKPSLQRIVDNAKDNPTMLASLDGKKNALVSPETISATILEKLLDVATEHTKKQITRAVIGVPAYFNDAQREATIRAANQAGIEKVKLLREPEAAALAYGVDKGSENEELVLVFDLGGGTYDVSILLVEKGLTEIVCTSGDSQLGGSNFDSKLAKHLSSILGNCCRSDLCHDTMLLAAEQIRIYLSNNRVAQLALPLNDQGWIELDSPKQVIISKSNDLFETNTRNETHLFYEISRKEMEKLCLEELQLLLRPIREVAIMAGALLPGDARPSIVESSLEIEGAFSEDELFYKDETDDVDSSTQEAIKSAVEEIDYKAAKKQQQKGRRKARKVAKEDRKFREETQKVKDKEPEMKIRGDGISGRPITRLVLVGGATRMPAIGRLLTALTGCAPQKTIDPDEAVALGCAVHVGVLDGKEEMGTVLNPMQAALLRAVIEKKSREEGGLDEFFDDDDDEFGDFEDVEIF